MQLQPVDALLAIALAAVFITLCFGIYSMMKGGQYARSNSNKLMRLRVALQFVAIIVLVAAFWFKRGG
jgi:multisubunit Na+/H+ antiporter MnhB subunit